MRAIVFDLLTDDPTEIVSFANGTTRFGRSVEIRSLRNIAICIVLQSVGSSGGVDFWLQGSDDQLKWYDLAYTQAIRKVNGSANATATTGKRNINGITQLLWDDAEIVTPPIDDKGPLYVAIYDRISARWIRLAVHKTGTGTADFVARGGGK